eukprot:363048-Chlamydomonas_euryale.AAC.4
MQTAMHAAPSLDILPFIFLGKSWEVSTMLAPRPAWSRWWEGSAERCSSCGSTVIAGWTSISGCAVSQKVRVAVCRPERRHIEVWAALCRSDSEEAVVLLINFILRRNSRPHTRCTACTTQAQAILDCVQIFTRLCYMWHAMGFDQQSTGYHKGRGGSARSCATPSHPIPSPYQAEGQRRARRQAALSCHAFQPDQPIHRLQAA